MVIVKDTTVLGVSQKILKCRSKISSNFTNKTRQVLA